MMTQTLIEQLRQLKLPGMAAALQQQLDDELSEAMTFTERVGLMIQHEAAQRENERLHKRLRWAQLPQHDACLEDVARAPHGVDRITLTTVRDLGWIKKHLNVLITGPCGVGKSHLASALAHAACRADIRVRAFRMPRLVEELARAGARQRRSTLLKQLAGCDLLLLDDFGLAPLADAHKRDLLEILDDRYNKRSTLVTSQLPIEQWHDYLGDPTLADAILDRLVHNAYRLNLKGESMRKRLGGERQADRIHTPTLMRVGTVGFSSMGGISNSFAHARLIHRSLHQRHVPVELIVEPTQNHVIADEQVYRDWVARNLDWFGFWLDGREDASPGKAGQYARWRKLRKVHEAAMLAGARAEKSGG